MTLRRLSTLGTIARHSKPTRSLQLQIHKWRRYTPTSASSTSKKECSNPQSRSCGERSN